ncbi:hypothetical protein A2801_04000 [Candidatus Woesebacteria bacterium RIFCSPHIGHO2_01_FULL_41_10]|uniref:DUF2905 domain-containing protein n=1 Tax=Candidatus Woesebacteria bacterium RIFCSPHIGHO2_01_FULL_41_10 TaxID=1802500 RepID=A0A1F7YQX4_9BACT|nr:MAG: hypothetical protein A2801_04000 [Candidatus Woesebacteria bacterium RIFCSPHIGHO2_01_FULL_41_10]
MQWKKFLQRYGAIFGASYVVGFLFLVTFYERFKFPPQVGDLLVVRESFTIYIPFGASFVIGVFVTVMYEIYKLFKH